MKLFSLRTCLTCRVIKPQNELIRLTLDKDNQVIIDSKKKMGGRGTYVCNEKCLKQAMDENLFSRAFRKKVVVRMATMGTATRTAGVESADGQ